jgi:hypothetical protein
MHYYPHSRLYHGVLHLQALPFLDCFSKFLPITSLAPHLCRIRGPLPTRDCEPVTITLQALSLVERRGRSKFTSHYASGTNRVSECKMDVKSTWIPTWHQMDHGYLDYFQNHLVEVGLTHSRKTMALRKLTTVGLFYFITCKDPHE